MFIQRLEATIAAFKRYVDELSSSDCDFTDCLCQMYKGELLVRFHQEDYFLTAYLDDNDELHVENDRGESIFDYAEEHEWTPEQIAYVKTGGKNMYKLAGVWRFRPGCKPA